MNLFNRALMPPFTSVGLDQSFTSVNLFHSVASICRNTFLAVYLVGFSVGMIGVVTGVASLIKVRWLPCDFTSYSNHMPSFRESPPHRFSS